jgi:formamidopyrimidine-DNA glycosylase
MPELPEVETMRRGILSVTGATIREVQFPPCRKRPLTISPPRGSWPRRLVGAKVTSVERIGKRLVLKLSSADVLVFEPRMTGLVLLAEPPTMDHLRLVLRFRGHKTKQLLFWDRRGLGVLRLLSASELKARLGPEKLGPDALAISALELRERLHVSRRAIKVALLDQKAVAGIGNLYAAEILFLAGISPRRRCTQLTVAQWQAIHKAMQDVLSTAIKCEGSTLSDGTYRNALNQSGSYQNQHRVYGKQGDSCRRCKTPIVRIVQAQRSTFYCPKCQR